MTDELQALQAVKSMTAMLATDPGLDFLPRHEILPNCVEKVFALPGDRHLPLPFFSTNIRRKVFATCRAGRFVSFFQVSNKPVVKER
jgi:hypothetical protein